MLHINKLLIAALVLTAFGICRPHTSLAQAFPNPITLSTGQGPIGSFDPIWLVSPWYSSNPPNPMGLSFTPAVINNNCAPGSWVDPASLPAPVNNGNWITGPGPNCSGNLNAGYIYFRLTLDLPADCNGNSIATSGNYVLYFDGYVDNIITDVFVNGTSTGINGGGYSVGSQLSITLTGPWQPGLNYVDIQVYNLPNGGNANPYGLLLVANNTATSNVDGDGDGVTDLTDQCPCNSGALANGCPQIVITGDSILCAGESTTLSTTGFGSLLWSTGDTTASITVSPGNNTTYKVRATLSNGYSDSATIQVVVHPNPAVNINPSAAALCAGASTTLSAAGAVNYMWSNAANSNSISVSPASSNTYSVTGTDANGCSGTASSAVTVHPLPVAGINLSQAAICAGDSTTLTANGGSTYIWSSGETQPVVSVSPANTTSYSVTVTDTNNCTASTTASVTVNALPVAVINPVVSSICNGENATLTASGGTGYLWSNAAVSTSITVSPPGDTTYTVTVTNAAGCSDTATAGIVVYALPAAVITATTDTLCSGEPVTLTASGGVTYQWSMMQNTAIITNNPPTTTNYSVTVSDANQCSASATKLIVVIPAMNLSATATHVSCSGANDGSIDVTVSSGVAPYHYLWGDNSAVEDLSGLSSGTYTVTVTDLVGCTVSGSSTITEPNPLVLTSAVTQPTCPQLGNNGSAVLSSTGGTAPYSYTWANGATNDNLQQMPPGSYAVTLTDAHHCSATDHFLLAFIYDFDVTASQDDTINIGGSSSIYYTLTGNAGNYTSVWSPAFTLSCNSCNSPTATPNVSTDYTITITNDAGCIASDVLRVYVIPDYTLFAPNAFSPNNDGNNDVFKLFGEIQAVAFLDIQIFNRIGEKVFESQDHDFAWDGTYKGAAQAPGVFTWQMKITYLDGHREELRKGTLTLLK